VSRAWDAACDGRAMLDLLCTSVPWALAPGGILLIVHSAICGVEITLELLRQEGMKAAVVARRSEPFGPVMLQRIALLWRVEV
jgi:release factor glutamine methyltransferase